MADSPPTNEAECLLWVNKQLLPLGFQVDNLARDLDDGFYILKLLKEWNVDNLDRFHERRSGTPLPMFFGMENRKQICSILNGYTKELGISSIPSLFSKDDLFQTSLVDVIRVLQVIRVSNCAYKNASSEELSGTNTRTFIKVPHLNRSATQLEKIKVTSNLKKHSSFGGVSTQADYDDENDDDMPFGSDLLSSTDGQEVFCNQNPSSEHQSDCAVYADGRDEWESVKEGKVLRVFMSSTFRDMQKERDEFFKNAEKKLKDHANKRGIVLVFIDLRWGLTSDISKNGLVVVSCLESIDKCPYFLCTLGARYGWIPNHAVHEEWNSATYLKYPYLKEIPGLSVTEYEIIQGALKEAHIARRVFFYSRDENYALQHVAETEVERILYQPVDQQDRQNQTRLKEKIAAKYIISVYKTPFELMEMITDALRTAMDDDFPETNVNTEDQAHYQFMRHRLIGLEGRDSLIKQLRDSVLKSASHDDANILVLGAESGIGKSSVMSGLVRSIRASRDPSLIVIYHFVGCSNMSSYVENLTERVIRILFKNDAFAFSDDSEEGKSLCKKGLDYVLKTASKHGKRRVIVAVDAINQFVNSPQHPQAHCLNWLPKKTPMNISLIVSTIDTHQTCTALQSHGLSIIPVKKLTRRGVILASTSFMSRYNKSLSQQQMDMITEAVKYTSHPLYLRLVLDELRVFGVYEKVDFELEGLLSNTGFFDLYSMVIRRWELKYGREIVQVVMKVLFISRIGLNENELDKYVEYRMTKDGHPYEQTAWKSFLYVLLDSLFVRNGRYAFFHQLLTQSVEQYYFSSGNNLKNEYFEYGTWLLSEYGTSMTGESEVAETCHALFSSNQFESLCSYLKDENVVTIMLEGCYRYDFFHMWRELGKNGFSDKRMYQDIVKKLTAAGSKLVDYFCEIHENAFILPVIQSRIAQKPDEALDDLNMMGRVLNNLARYKEAMEVLTKALEISTKTNSRESKEVAESAFLLGQTQSFLGRFNDALIHFEKSLNIRLKIFGEDNADVADSYNNIGGVYRNMAKYDLALEHYQKALQIRLKIFNEENPDVSNSYTSIAAVYNNLANYKECLYYLEKSLAIRRKIFGEDHPDTADAYNNMGSFNSDIGKFDKALEYYNTSLFIRKKLFEDSHPTIADTYTNIGTIYWRQEKFQDALAHFQSSLEIQQNLFGVEHPNVASTLNNIGNVHDDLKDHEKALELYQKSLEIRKNIYGEEHPTVAVSYSNIAVALQNLGRYEDSLAHHLKCLDIRQKIYDGMHPDIAHTYINIGVIYKKMRRLADSEACYRKSLAIRLQVLGNLHPSTGNSFYSLGNIYMMLREYRRAFDMLNKANESFVVCYGENHSKTKEVRERLTILQSALKST